MRPQTSNTGCLGHRCGGSGVEGRMVVTPRKALFTRPSVLFDSELVQTTVILTLGTFCQSKVQDCPVKKTQKVRMTGNSFNKRVRFWTKWPQIVKTIVILTSGRQNDSNFDIRYFLSIGGPRLSRKNDPKSQNDGEFLQQKGPFLTK